jgi:hypothetical protein
MPTSHMKILTSKHTAIDVTDIIPYSILLSDMGKHTYHIHAPSVDDSPTQIHQKTLHAVEAFKLLPKMIKMIHQFNHPINTETSLETIREQYYEFYMLFQSWNSLTHNNIVCEWLYLKPEYTRMLNNNMYYWYSEHLLHYSNKQDCFKYACMNGDIQEVKWVYSLGNIDIHEDDDIIFCKVCQYGKLDIAKWIYSLGDVNIHGNNNLAFDSQLYVISWLHSLEES